MDARFGRSGEIDRSARLAKHSLQHRFKGFERHRSEIRIKRDLVEQAAEFFGLLEIRVLPEFFARVPIEPQIVEKVISLKDRVMLDDPVVPMRRSGSQCRSFWAQAMLWTKSAMRVRPGRASRRSIW